MPSAWRCQGGHCTSFQRSKPIEWPSKGKGSYIPQQCFRSFKEIPDGMVRWTGRSPGPKGVRVYHITCFSKCTPLTLVSGSCVQSVLRLISMLYSSTIIRRAEFVDLYPAPSIAHGFPQSVRWKLSERCRSIENIMYSPNFL